jgi:hypothetical protein
MVHGENYTYDRVIYQNSFIKICVTCALHGDFWIAPDCLLSGQRCYECSLSARGLKRRKTFDDFLEEARETHGDKYSYDRDSYRDASTKMIIACPDHGDFEQIPKSHLTGRGCSDCADTGFNPNRQAYVYCLKSSDGAFVKVGITGNMATRMATLKCLTPFEFEQVGTICVDGFKAREIEKRIHNGFMSAGLSGFQGCTEWLRHDERIISMFV